MRTTLPLFLLALVSLPACSGSGAEEISGPRFVAVGAAGTILHAEDGITWKSADSGIKTNLSSIAYGANIFVAVGDGGVILTSLNGVEFKQRYSPTGVDLVHVIHTGEQFVAVGGDFNVGAVTVTSTNGIDWENIVAPGSYMFHAVAHKSTTLIAAAFSRSDMQTPALFTAVPGQSWQEDVGPDFRDSITTTEGVFTVGGSSVNHFVDGLGWTSQTVSPNASAHTMTHGANTFVVGGEMGGLYSSPDGLVFTDHSLTGETGFFQGVVHNGTDRFVAVGSGGMIATSTDAASWTKATTPTTLGLSDVAYGGVP